MKILLSISFLFALTGLMAQSADDIVGLWLVENEDAYIRIYERGGEYFGKVAWLEEPYDEEGNPQTDDKGDEVFGMEIMKNFEFDEDEWNDGTIYDAQTGKTYHGSIEMEDRNTLNLRGSVDSFGLIGRTESWTRLEER